MDSDDSAGSGQASPHDAPNFQDLSDEEYQLLASIDGLNRLTADLYTEWSWRAAANGMRGHHIRSKLDAVEDRVTEVRDALDEIESVDGDSDA